MTSVHQEASLVGRRLVNQQLAKPRLATPAELVRWMGAVQAQDYRGALWAIGQRLASTTESDVEAAIASRAIVRTWPMRGTLHLVPSEDARWMLRLLTPRVIAHSAGRYRGLGLDRAALTRSARLLERALEGGRALTRPEAYAALERGGIACDAQRGIHVLGHLAQQGLLCQGARRERQPTFVLLEEWIRRSASPSREEALARLATRYFWSHGPATLQDFAWWSGLLLKDAREAIAVADRELARADVDGRAGWCAISAAPVERAPGSAWLIPPWDEYVVAYRAREAVFGSVTHAHRDRLRAIGSPLVLIDGRVRGTWRVARVRGATRVVAAYWSSVTAKERRVVSEAAERYGRFRGIEVSA